jgi:hypothetical protein
VRPASIDCSECGDAVAVGSRGRLPTRCAACAPAFYEAQRRRSYRVGQRKPCPDCGTSIGLKSHFCQSCVARRTWAKRNAGKERACPVCSETFISTKSRLVYCSRSCWRVRKLLSGQTCAVPWCYCRLCAQSFVAPTARAKRMGLCSGCAPLFARVKAIPALYYRTCQHCTRPFTTNVAHRLKFCSEACGRRAHKVTRKAREKASRPETTRRVYFAYICERDRWRCHVCGKRVSIKHEAPHPLAPTRDHIIPLARGGTHESANVKLAHYGCNSARGDRGGNEQLLLVG